MMAPQPLVLGLGSNVGDREGFLVRAIAEIAHFMPDLRRSSIIETPALLPENAPLEWGVPYLNMAVMGECALEPLAVLAACKAVEQLLGRQNRGHWGPREIDVDILVYGDWRITSEALTIPHQRLLERPFALIPLRELWPEWGI